jgi:two-component system, LuxR family, response regulator FixJ
MGDTGLEACEQRVVIVDDDLPLLSALQFALELEGFAVEAYRGGGEVLSSLDLPAAGCLVIDYHLLGMNGLDLLAALRSRRVDLPAILITTHPSSELRQRAAAQGMQIIEKPLLGDALLEAIRCSLAGGLATSG